MDKKKVFLLDNSKSFLSIISSSIKSSSLVVRTERQADLALLKIINWFPDILITSVEVGNIKGFDLCLILKMMPDFAGMPIILISSHETDDASRKAASAGADLYIQKDRKLIGNLKRGIDRLLLNPQEGACQDVKKRVVKNVLVVDDSRMMRRIIKNMLTSLGIKSIIEAEDGEQGIERLQENNVDMVISDWNMPKMNGCEFVTRVRKDPRYDDLCFVLVTAEKKQEIDKALTAGANDYLNKPFNAQAIKNLIAKFASNIQPFST